MISIMTAKILLAMALSFMGINCAGKAPSGALIYCSYASSGSAGLGKEYCELIADPGTQPKVVVAMRIGNRFGDPEIHEEFPVDSATVERLQAGLAELKVHRLNGYHVEEPISGGYAHRIHIEYASGEQITADWYGHKIKDSAIAAYNRIERFFAPWREIAEERNKVIGRLALAVEKPGKAGRDTYELFCEGDYSPHATLNLHLGSSSKSPVYKQFDPDQEGIDAFRQDLKALGIRELGQLEQDKEAGRNETAYDLELSYDRNEVQHLRWTSGTETPQLKAIRERIIRFFSKAR